MPRGGYPGHHDTLPRAGTVATLTRSGAGKGAQMPENAEAQAAEQAAPQEPQQPPEAAQEAPKAEQPRTYTKEQLEAAIKARVDRQNGRHAEELAALQAQLAEAEGRAKAASEEAESMRAAKARADAVAEAAKAHGVDAELLAMMAGDEPERIEANAEALAAKMRAVPAYPVTSDSAVLSAPAPSRESIAGIADPNERLAAIASNLHLYK